MELDLRVSRSTSNRSFHEAQTSSFTDGMLAQQGMKLSAFISALYRSSSNVEIRDSSSSTGMG